MVPGDEALKSADAGVLLKIRLTGNKPLAPERGNGRGRHRPNYVIFDGCYQHLANTLRRWWGAATAVMGADEPQPAGVFVMDGFTQSLLDWVTMQMLA